MTTRQILSCAVCASLGLGLGFFLAQEKAEVDDEQIIPESIVHSNDRDSEPVSSGVIERIVHEPIKSSASHLNNQIENLEEENFNLRKMNLGLEQRVEELQEEVLESDFRVSSLESHVEKLLYSPEKSPLSSFARSSVGEETNSLERLIVLRALQEVPVTLSDSEAVWLLGHVRGNGLDINFDEFVAVLGPARVVKEMSKEALHQLEGRLSEQTWRAFFEGQIPD